MPKNKLGIAGLAHLKGKAEVRVVPASAAPSCPSWLRHVSQPWLPSHNRLLPKCQTPLLCGQEASTWPCSCSCSCMTQTHLTRERAEDQLLPLEAPHPAGSPCAGKGRRDASLHTASSSWVLQLQPSLEGFQVLDLQIKKSVLIKEHVFSPK